MYIVYSILSIISYLYIWTTLIKYKLKLKFKKKIFPEIRSDNEIVDVLVILIFVMHKKKSVNRAKYQSCSGYD